MTQHRVLARGLRFPEGPVWMKDGSVALVEIERGTPAYAGANFGYQPDQYYPTAVYHGVPNRADFLCDWPYAARRYNGSGNDSFHYQTRILLNLLAEPPVTWS